MVGSPLSLVSPTPSEVDGAQLLSEDAEPLFDFDDDTDSVGSSEVVHEC